MSLVVAVTLLLADPAPLEVECKARRKAGTEPAVAADVCRQAFEAVPDGPSDRHTLLLGTAHALYLKAFREKPDPALACADEAMLRAYERQLATLPADDRPGDRADVRKALAEITPLCSPPPSKEQRQPAPPPPLVTSRPPPAPVNTYTDRPRRPLRAAGGAVLGVGLGAGLAMVGALIRGASLRAQVEATYEMHDTGSQIPMSDLNEYNGDLARGRRANNLAIAFGVTATALTTTGVALLIADRRSVARRIALTPRPLGFHLAMEF